MARVFSGHLLFFLIADFSCSLGPILFPLSCFFPPHMAAFRCEKAFPRRSFFPPLSALLWKELCERGRSGQLSVPWFPPVTIPLRHGPLLRGIASFFLFPLRLLTLNTIAKAGLCQLDNFITYRAFFFECFLFSPLDRPLCQLFSW